MRVLGLVILAALALAGCTNGGCADCGQRDLWGNVYPVECTDLDLADRVDISRENIVVMPEELFPDAILSNGQRGTVLALCLFCGVPGSVPGIWLSERLSTAERPSAIQHEDCHRYEFLVGKDVNWHPAVQFEGK